jgi:hypothetical protein
VEIQHVEDDISADELDHTTYAKLAGSKERLSKVSKRTLRMEARLLGVTKVGD